MRSRTVFGIMPLFAVTLWIVTLAAPSLRAQDSAARQAVTVLTEDSLKQMLDNMGYEPKKLSKGYLLSIKRDTWTIHMQLTLSNDRSKLGFNSNLGVVENLDGVTAEQWRNLLISNGNIDPSFFFLDKESKKLYLHRVLDNRSIDPAFLRAQIDNFCANVKETADLWKFTK